MRGCGLSCDFVELTKLFLDFGGILYLFFSLLIQLLLGFFFIVLLSLNIVGLNVVNELFAFIDGLLALLVGEELFNLLF